MEYQTKSSGSGTILPPKSYVALGYFRDGDDESIEKRLARGPYLDLYQIKGYGGIDMILNELDGLERKSCLDKIKSFVYNALRRAHIQGGENGNTIQK